MRLTFNQQEKKRERKFKPGACLSTPAPACTSSSGSQSWSQFWALVPWHGDSQQNLEVRLQALTDPGRCSDACSSPRTVPTHDPETFLSVSEEHMSEIQNWNIPVWYPFSPFDLQPCLSFWSIFWLLSTKF